jgi:glycosyltransferase involved in cell wall biosynthesis
MKISVITVCFNSELTIRNAVESFLHQSYPDREMIVIDGNSSDETVAIVNSYNSSLIKVYSEPDGGIYDAMNKGFGRFTGEAFGFLNSDDRYTDSESLARVAEGLSQFDMIFGHIRYVSRPGSRQSRGDWKSTPFTAGGFRKGWIVPHPAVYARRSVYETVGIFDTGYTIAADYDWILRALEIHGVNGGVLDAFLVDMMLGGKSSSNWRALLTNIREPLRSRQRWLESGIIDAAVFTKNLRKLKQFMPSL